MIRVHKIAHATYETPDLDQQTEWQTSIAQVFATTGWGGRLADAMKGCNTSNFPMIVSVGGNALFSTGSQTTPATVTPGQVLGLQGFSGSAANIARFNALANLLNFNNGYTLVNSGNAISYNGINQAGSLNQALAGGSFAPDGIERFEDAWSLAGLLQFREWLKKHPPR